jgi:predicted Zn finger-like uncharacterized protein
MIVTCESCKTKFRLDPSRLKGEKSKVRCSRCSHVFTVQRPQEEILLKMDQPEQEINFDEDFVQPLTVPGPANLYLKKQKSVLGRRIIGVAALILVLVFGFFLYSKLSDLFSASKSQADRQQASTATDIRPAVTILDSTQAYFLENVNAGQIFVIEGEVANESTAPVSFILLEGKLYGADNRVAQSQRCFCGNLLKREELAQLSITEIQNAMMNREGKDLSNVHLLPGNRVPFMLVFHNLPELDALSDYSIEVISAKSD